MTRNIAYIGLGSNIGDRESYLLKAMKALGRQSDIKIIDTSSIYETDPYGPVQQQDFLNMVVKVRTTLSPERLLEKTQSIECQLERVRNIHWGPRTIDLDILLYNQDNVKMDNLKIPHPELKVRDFVIIPLYELDPTLTIPGSEKSIALFYSEMEDTKGVRLWKRINGEEESAPFES